METLCLGVMFVIRANRQVQAIAEEMPPAEAEPARQLGANDIAIQHSPANRRNANTSGGWANHHAPSHADGAADHGDARSQPPRSVVAQYLEKSSGVS